MKSNPAIQVFEMPIEYVKGVGPQRAEWLRKEAGLNTLGDLLTYYPFRYVDRTRFYKIAELSEDMNFVQIKGRLEHLEIGHGKRNKPLTAVLRDETGSVDLVWFQGQQWIAEKLRTGQDYVVFGRAALFKGRISFSHPEMNPATPAYLANQSPFEGVYSSTEKLRLKGLASEGIRRLIRAALQQVQQEDLPETLTPELISRLKFPALRQALNQIHFPEDRQALEKATLRLKFEELFYIQLRLLRIRGIRRTQNSGRVFSKVGANFNEFYNNHLPFPLTSAQKRVLKEIHQDMKSGKQMSRLLQGDVGSGKTLVALMCILLALDNGYQACLMAPTEILAQQHAETFTALLKPLGLVPLLLTGSTKTAARKKILESLKEGHAPLAIGTHALLEDAVQFRNLGLVVIDEQHRFGVAQRARLQLKHETPPHVLIMTATPIPRTLAMTLYGDLDTSVIDEMPPGRKAIKTYHYTESARLKVLGFMKQQIALGRQIYVVYPLIQESEKLDYQNLQVGYDNLVKEFPPPNYQLSIVHGKLSHEQKEQEMQRFIKGQTQIMVATTVIEVGVNIPNASVMVIESAERFGLSQLHQLRGRVGRGAEQSYCVLMTGYKLGPDSRQRMQAMVDSNDGFVISELDLKLRGPGDIEGTAQSGILDLKLADLSKDAQILSLARDEAIRLLEQDPDLQAPAHRLYQQELQRRQQHRNNWSKIA